MSPLPPTGKLAVMPTNWSEHNRPAAYGFLTGTSTARHPAQIGDLHPGEHAREIDGGTLWTDMPTSVQALTEGSRPTVIAGATETIATHRMSTPIDAPWPTYGDEIIITANPDDPDLNGRILQVLVVETGTTNWTRDILCLDQNRQEGDGS